MVARSIVVALRADISDFRRQMSQAGRETTDAMEKVGGAMTAVGAVAALGVGAAVKAFSDFDAQMSKVQAATHDTASQMATLRQAALDAGQSTKFSATEAAQGIEELSKAGVSTADVLGGGLKGALSLAAAGGMDVGAAAETAASAMTQFGLAGSDLPHVADLLAAGAGKAQGSVADMGAALNQSGLIANQFGISVEDTTGALAAFASAGLTGSDAGTSLKTMLIALANPSVQSAGLMKQLGINAYDAQGNFIGLTRLAGVLQDRLGGLSEAQRNQALGQIFGTDAMRAASVLYADGAAGVADWTKKVDDSGYAAKTAAMMMDNLQGDVSNLGSSLETALIKGGSSANGSLRALTQGATGLVNVLGGLGGPVNTVALGVTAVTAGVGLLGGAALLAAPKVIELRAAMTTLGTAAPRTASAIGIAGKAAGVAAGAFVALTAAQAAGKHFADVQISSTEQTTKALLAMGTSLDQVNALIAKAGDKTDANWNFTGLADAAHKLNDSNVIGKISGSLGELLGMGGKKGLEDELGAIGTSLGNLVSSGHADVAKEQFDRLAAEWVRGGGSVKQLRELMPGYADALAGAANKQALASGSAADAAAAIGDMGDAADAAATDVNTLNDRIDALFGQFYSVTQASDEMQAKLLDLAEATKKNGSSLEGNTKGAIANREAVIDLVRAADDQIQAMQKQGATQQEVTATAASLKTQIIDAARAAGLNADQAANLAAQLDKIPGTYGATVTTQGLNVSAVQAAGFLRTLQQIDGMTITTRYQSVGSPVIGGQRAGLAVARADGGLIPYGMGGPREDNVVAHVSSGEYVVNAAATAKHLPLIEAINAGRFADGGLIGAGRFASGGQVPALSLPGVSAAPSLSPASLAAALAGQATAAAAATAAWVRLNEVQATGASHLAALQAQLDAGEAALQARQDADTARAEAALEALKQSQQAQTDALKRAHEDQARALQRAQTDEMDALKAHDAAVLDRLRASKASQAVIDRQAAANDAAEKALDRRQEDAATAADRARDAESARLAATQDAQVAAAEGKLTAAKKAGTAASQALAAADKKRMDAAQAAQEAAQTALQDQVDAARAEAQAQLDAAQAAVDAAAKRLTDATQALQAAQDQARSLAEGITGQVTGGFDLSALLSGGADTASVLDAAGKQVSRAGELDAAVKTLMGQGLDAALVDQITAKGTAGLDLTRRLLAGGPDLVSGLNTALAQVTASGADLGGYISSARYGSSIAGLQAGVSSAQYAYNQAQAAQVSLTQESQALLNRAIAAANPDVYLDGKKITAAVNAMNDRLGYRKVTR